MLMALFTEERKDWGKELPRHCYEVNVHPEDTKEEQEMRILKYQKEGNKQFTEDGRVAEITSDLILQARAKMSKDKVNGPEDSAVSEMIKQLPQEKYEIVKCFFQQRFMGLQEAPSSWKMVKLVLLRKSDAAPKERDQKLQGYCADVGDVEVVCDLLSTVWKRKNT